MNEKSDDPDYRMLSGYLAYHYAPVCFHNALDRIIKRSGLRIPLETPITSRISSKIEKRQPIEVIPAPTVQSDIYEPLKREPVKEYLDEVLGVMVKVFPAAHARIR